MEEYLIIDGQQRLITISLLLLAIHHLICSGEMECKDQQLADKILKQYLIDEFEPEEKRIKLKPFKSDQPAFGRNGSFSKVNPTTSNWVAGAVGVPGIHIDCVANFDETRVEFYLGTATKEKNKALFDAL